ncbi:DUF6159 family protein [Rhodohalobacter mucosus]|uniref:Membrane domain of glycerophosphoryl diester phosphodiesterase n=1 Tax=Rhodohalobacter mucosus TaxID=2079485 RepID=A0A316TMH4_9BACT|nr:DUF6159 family protein [Rhodohalobacter mucosus]PWN05803.1 hypothetical protein DDZ15_11450 [Rhodohalobacter mucosus]
MKRISNTWELIKSSFRVLMEDKKMLLFPLLSGICTLIIVASFFIPAFVTGFIPFLGDPDQMSNTALYVSVFCFYFINYFIVLFFNSAAVAYAIDLMRGGSPSFGAAFKKVQSRIVPLLGWTVIASTVGLILNTIENQSDKIGRIVIAFFGLSWTIISFLVLPILIVEGKGPIASLSESVRMVKDVWAEQLVGHFSFGLLFGLVLIPVALLSFFVMSMDGLFMWAGLALLLAAGITAGVLQWILQSIFMGAVYLYVREDKVPDRFSLSQIDSAMR